jgi:hypothetical protein
MKKSMHINESIPVTITHVKQNRKTVIVSMSKYNCYKFSVYRFQTPSH